MLYIFGKLSRCLTRIVRKKENKENKEKRPLWLDIVDSSLVLRIDCYQLIVKSLLELNYWMGLIRRVGCWLRSNTISVIIADNLAT